MMTFRTSSVTILEMDFLFERAFNVFSRSALDHSGSVYKPRINYGIAIEEIDGKRMGQ